MELVNSDLCKIIVCLGVFYVEMSFFGSIGYLMVGFGLWELLEFIYVFNVVDYIMIGKVIFCVVCVYFIVDVVLNVFLYL